VFPALIHLALALLLAAFPAAFPAVAAEPPTAAPFVVSGDFAPAGPGVARGAVVWLHGSYDSATETPPALPDWLLHLPRLGYDLWLFNRRRGEDPLAGSGERLLEGLAGLRRAGYRRVVVAGFSRGAFISLAALARPDLADAVAAVSPAAHGTRTERRAQALADFQERMKHAAGGRLALVLLRDDPWDPDPAARVAAAVASRPAQAAGLLLIDRPDAPAGHMGSFDAPFDARFGTCIAAFLDGVADAGACRDR